MNNNCIGLEKNVVISARCEEDNEIKDIFGESIMRICWDEFSCGVFVGMESKSAYVFAQDIAIKQCISAVWDHWDITSAVEQASRSEGLDGVIKVCMDFVMAFAAELLEWMGKTEETA